MSNVNQSELDDALRAAVEAEPFLYPVFEEAVLAGGNPDVLTKNDTPILVELMKRGHFEAAHVLVNAGANVNLPDAKGETALFHAITANEVLVLLEAGASPLHQNKLREIPSKSIEHKAVRSGVQPFRDNAHGAMAVLKECESIERAYRKGTHTLENYAALWKMSKQNADRLGTSLPDARGLPFALRRFRDADVDMPKSVLLEAGNYAGAGVRYCSVYSPASLRAWRKHCDLIGTPMTPQDWKDSGILEGLTQENKLAELFNPDYWSMQKDIGPMFQLFSLLPARGKEKILEGNAKAISESFAQWEKSEHGQQMSLPNMQKILRQVPGELRPFLYGLHQIIADRQRRRVAEPGVAAVHSH